MVASDVTALLHRTRRVIYLENGEVAVVRRGCVCAYSMSREREIERAVETLDWDAARAEKGGYRHFMLKEIFEQPDAIRNTVRAYLDPDRRGVNLDGLGFSDEELARLRRIHLVACGTSWHACLVGKFVLEELTGLPTEVDYASEYRYRTPLLGDDLLVVGVTQSGETADTLAAMEMARDGGALLATVCNVRGSSSWRLAPSRMLTQAGPEIGVASTKAFTTQLVALVLMALGLRRLADSPTRSTRAGHRACSGCRMAVEEALGHRRRALSTSAPRCWPMPPTPSIWAAASSTPSPSRARSSSRRSPTSTPRAIRRAR